MVTKLEQNSEPGSEQSLEQRAKIFDALSDPTRLRIVELLMQSDELSGSEIAHQMDISLALFCHHSKVLADAGVIKTRKEGQSKYHTLDRPALAGCFNRFAEFIQI